MIVPPKPTEPPNTQDQIKLQQLPPNTREMDTVNPAYSTPKYRQSLHIMAVLIKIVPVTLITIMLITGYIYLGGQSVFVVPWYVYVITLVVPAAYCYCAWISWRGQEFVVNELQLEHHHVLPIVETRTPTFQRREIASIDVVQSMVDKIFGTCHLVIKTSRTPSVADEDHDRNKALKKEDFNEIHWLKNPSLLRCSLGMSEPDQITLLGRKKKNAT